jgi:diadenosine tetraphosphate (Ap4A) HIT family hydrolase
VFHVHFHVLPRWKGDNLVKLGKSGSMIAKDDAEALLKAMGVR